MILHYIYTNSIKNHHLSLAAKVVTIEVLFMDFSFEFWAQLVVFIFFSFLKTYFQESKFLGPCANFGCHCIYLYEELFKLVYVFVK